MVSPQTNIPAPKWNSRNERRQAEGPDPVEYPEYYEDITMKRVFAYAIDFIICAVLGLVGWFIAAIVGLMSFGLLLAPMMMLLALIPIAYHTYFIGTGNSATLGMRFCGIRVYRLDGGKPELLQAFIQTAVFFFTISATSLLILIVCLFNTRRRCLHDMLAGTLILNDLEKTD